MSDRHVLVLIAGMLMAPMPASAQRRASWSPNGRQLAFSFGDHDSAGIWVVGVDSSGLRQVYASGKTDMYPSWAPRGEEIAFTSNRDGQLQIYVVNADGSGFRRLTTEGQNAYCSWSPDGKHIAFTSNRTGKWRLFVANADGSGALQVTHTATNEWNPEWSPDGEWLVFESTRNGHDQDDVYAVNVTTGAERQLTRSLDNEICPSWSPDGNRIAYTVVIPRVRGDLYLMTVRDSSSHLLLENGALPQWSRQGALIAFERSKGNAPGIYILDVSSRAVRRVVR